MLQTITPAPDKDNRHYQASQPRRQVGLTAGEVSLPANEAGLPYVRPFRIIWHGKTYSVKNINNYYIISENGVQFHIFTASDGKGTFELKFTNDDVAWFLGN